MKTKTVFLIAIVAGLLESCSTVPVTYYQVFKASAEGLQKSENSITYEDENCQVTYNLWGEGGIIGFRFYNKTEQDLYLSLDQCYFIMNGYANNYFKNRTYTKSKVEGVNTTTGVYNALSATRSESVTGINYFDLLKTNSITASASESGFSSSGFIASKGYSVAFNEEKVACIPAKSYKVISEYSIIQYQYRDCDLFLFPSKNETAVKSFNKSNSPYVFSNRIVYRIGENGVVKNFENTFFVSEISNLSKEEMFLKDYKKNCGEKDNSKSYFYKDATPDKFFIKYDRPENYWLH